MWIAYSLEAAFWLGVLCSAAGMLCRDRTAGILCMAAIVSIALDITGADFALWGWVLIDVVTAVLIIRPGLRRRDVFILALFLPCWGVYFLPDPWRYFGSSALVALQLVMTAPLAQLRAKVRRLDPRDIFKDTLFYGRGE